MKGREIIQATPKPRCSLHLLMLGCVATTRAPVKAAGALPQCRVLIVLTRASSLFSPTPPPCPPPHLLPTCRRLTGYPPPYPLPRLPSWPSPLAMGVGTFDEGAFSGIGSFDEEAFSGGVGESASLELVALACEQVRWMYLCWSMVSLAKGSAGVLQTRRGVAHILKHDPKARNSTNFAKKRKKVK